MFDRPPPFSWLPKKGVMSEVHGGPPFFVHPDWVERHRYQLIRGERSSLLVHFAHNQVFLSTDPSGPGLRATTEGASYMHFLKCSLAVAAPTAFPRAFHRLAALDHGLAVEVLERGGLEALGGLIELPVERLEATDLRELLGSRQVLIRQRAVAWLDQDKGGATATLSAHRLDGS